MLERSPIVWIKRFGMLAILVALCAVLSVMHERFFTVDNLLGVSRQASINALLAAGMTLVILTGGIDLSVGSVLALSGAVSAGVLAATGSVPLAILAALAVGSLIGAVNGILTAYPNLPPFIVTLATMAWARGLTLVYTDGRPILANDPTFRFIGGGYVWGVPMPVIILLAAYVLVYLFLKNTKWGRLIYAIGGNEEACRLAGIPVNRIKTFVYTAAGLFSGLAGVVLTSRLISAQPTAGATYELDAIAAVILGGTSLQGGRGTIVGTIIGAMIMGVLDNGLNLMNVSPFYQEVAKGFIILFAVLLDWMLNRAGALGGSAPRNVTGAGPTAGGASTSAAKGGRVV